MADPANNGAEGAVAPSLNALAQYCKDFSFENPNAPRSLQPQAQGPQINLQVNVNAKQLAQEDFEVELSLNGDAKINNDVLFAFELTYAGVFRVRNIPQDQLHPLVMIECPRLLFPFARQIIAEAAQATTRVQVTRIEVAGHADTSGTPRYNQGLSQRRAQNVASELVRLGVPREAITVQAFGESRPLVATGDGVREPQNRRVEIVLR